MLVMTTSRLNIEPSTLFARLLMFYPDIIEVRSRGISHDAIIRHLADEHGLEIKKTTYKKYLQRFKGQGQLYAQPTPSKSVKKEKQSMVKPSEKPVSGVGLKKGLSLDFDELESMGN